MKGPRRPGEQPAQSAPRGHEGTISPGQLSRGFRGLGRTGRASPCSLSRSPGGAANLTATLAGRSWPPGCGLTRSGCLWLVCTGVQVTTEPAPLLPASSGQNHPATAKPVCTHTPAPSAHPERAGQQQEAWLSQPAPGHRGCHQSSAPSNSQVPEARTEQVETAPTRHPPPADPEAGSPAMPSDHSCQHGATF